MSVRHQLVSSGSPYEPRVGISRAVRAGALLVVSGAAPLGPDGRTVARAHGEVFRDIRPANTIMQVTPFIDPDWLVEIEADAVVPDTS